MLKKVLSVIAITATILSADCSVDEIVKLKDSGFSVEEIKEVCSKKQKKKLNEESSNSLENINNEEDLEYRKGFYAAFGLGYHSINNKYNDYNYNEDKSGLVTSLNIGYGFTNNFLLFYSNNVSWYNIDSVDEENLIANGLTAIGISYFVQKNLYLTASYGLASAVNLSDSDSATFSGTGYELGAGYEFAQRWNIEGIYRNSSFDTEKSSYGTYDIDAESTSIHFGIKYSWY